MGLTKSQIWDNVATVAKSCPKWVRQSVKQAARDHVSTISLTPRKRKGTMRYESTQMKINREIQNSKQQLRNNNLKIENTKLKEDIMDWVGMYNVAAERAYKAEAILKNVKKVFNECNIKNSLGEMSVKETMRKCRTILSDISEPLAIWKIKGNRGSIHVFDGNLNENNNENNNVENLGAYGFTTPVTIIVIKESQYD